MGREPTGTLGARAEQQAFRFLLDRGLQPVARNFRSRGGEIDLIMLHGDCLTFIEVRCRRSTRFTKPALTVDFRKQRKIVRTSALFCARHRVYANHVMRFDVVAVEGTDPPAIEWVRDAFRPTDAML